MALRDNSEYHRALFLKRRAPNQYKEDEHDGAATEDAGEALPRVIIARRDA
jgi:hypothetical protein